jgi:Flp pilus assembly protein TadG
MIKRHTITSNSVLKRFASEQRGSVAIIFALAMVPVLGMAGAAIDYGAASSARAQMAQASDAAALAAAKAPVTTLA